MNPQLIMEAVENALVDAFGNNNNNYCVNWGDLSCVNVEKYVDLYGEGIRAYVEEAAPDNMEFREFIRAHVKKATGLDVEIITEW